MKYVIGDIHCEYIKLKNLLKKIQKKDNQAEFYSVGDIVNRKYGIKRILFLIKKYNIKVVKGNNEQQYLDNYYDLVVDMIDNGYLTKEYWLQEKVINVLLEYNIVKLKEDRYYFQRNRKDLESFHKLLSYLSVLPIEITIEDKDIKINNYSKVIISHSGIGNIYEKYKNDKHNVEYHKIITENRDKDYIVHNFFNIFGHTPIKKEDIELKKSSHYINIDSGACYSSKKNKNPLTAISLFDGKLYQVF